MNYAHECADFQEKYLEMLKQKSFLELSTLPIKQRVKSPKPLGGWKVFLLKKEGEHGGIRIEVEGQKRFLVFVTKYTTGFEILKDETVIEDEGYDEELD
jgi:hypothetical protein